MGKACSSLVLTLVLLFSSCSAEPDDNTPASPPLPRVPYTEVSIPQDAMGMVHAGSKESEAEYTLLDELNVHWMLNDFSWGSIQQTSPENADTWDHLGNYDTYANMAESHNKKILA
jgi:hypothetical protein